MKYLAPLLIVLAGCCTPDTFIEPTPTNTPSDALLLADPSAVTDAQLLDEAHAREVHHQRFSQVEGVTWEPMYYDPASAVPDGYGKGGDAALMTGLALGAYSFQSAHTGDVAARHNVLACLRGLYYLTNVAGSGVIARAAFDKTRKAEWNFARWGGRDKYDGDFVVETDSPLPGPPLPGSLGEPFAPSVYYTRATRDQLSGITFGLSVAWKLVPESRAIVALIAKRLYDRLDADDWDIRDANGDNDTNADHIDGYLKTAFLLLCAKASGRADLQKLYEDTFVTDDLGTLFHAFSNGGQYYAHNLRAARSIGAWVIEDHAGRKAAFADYYRDHVWAHVEGHQNAWFAYGAAGLLGDEAAAAEGRLALASLSFRPTRSWPSPYAGQKYTEPGYICALFGNPSDYALPPHLRYANTSNFLWQKQPWRIEPVAADPANPPAKATTGVSYLLAYWLARWLGSL